MPLHVRNKEPRVQFRDPSTRFPIKEPRAMDATCRIKGIFDVGDHLLVRGIVIDPNVACSSSPDRVDY